MNTYKVKLINRDEFTIKYEFYSIGDLFITFHNETNNEYDIYAIGMVEYVLCRNRED